MQTPVDATHWASARFHAEAQLFGPSESSSTGFWAALSEDEKRDPADFGRKLGELGFTQAARGPAVAGEQRCSLARIATTVLAPRLLRPEP